MMNVANRIHLNQTDSTNTYLKELLMSGVELPELTLVDTESQTKGRGQAGNSWESRDGENLTFSWLCHPTFISADNQFVLSQVVALAVRGALSEFVDDVTIKWPNDIYWKDKKTCGILIECTLAGASVKDCIMGVGVNVNQKKFYSDAPNPVSLAQIVGLTFNREVVLEKLTDKFNYYYEMLKSGKTSEIIAEYKNNLYRKTGFYDYCEPDGDPFCAEYVDVLKSGHLVLKDDKGLTREYEIKEVKFII